MAQSRFYSSTAQPTVLTSALTPSDTTIDVQQVIGFPASFPYILAVDYGTPSEELVLVTTGAGTNLTVTRAYDGTSGTSHDSGAPVRHVVAAIDETDSRVHEGNSAGVHGVSGNVVGTSGLQTLTQKTLTSPVINTPIISGGSLSGSITSTATVTGGSLVSPNITDAGMVGTWVGSPTMSGNVAFTGTPTFVDSTQTGTQTTNIWRSNNTTDVSLSSTGHAFQIGASSGANLRIDNNEIECVNNGAAMTIDINSDGGNVRFFNNITNVASTETLTHKGLYTQTPVATGSVTYMSVNSPSGSSGTALLGAWQNNGTTRFSVRNDGVVTAGNFSIDSGGAPRTTATNFASSSFENTTNFTSSSTSYVDMAGSLTVVVPPSGKVKIDATCRMLGNQNSGDFWAAINIVGTVTGTVRASADATAMYQRQPNTSNNMWSMGAQTIIVTSANPGETLTVKLQGRAGPTASLTIASDYRSVTATPLMG